MSERQILIVDDDADTCFVLVDVLGEFGYEADVAHNGADALKLAGRNTYRLVLLDYKMPQLTGVELFDRLRLRNGGLHGFLVTAHGTLDVQEQATRAGIERIFQKPVDVPELMNEVRAAVG